jgi:hypothetical protein
MWEVTGCDPAMARVAAVALDGWGKCALWSPEGSHLLLRRERL